jgi:hypothetical protein
MLIALIYPQNVFALPGPNEWSGAPYCPLGCPLDYLKQQWAKYYDFKGSQWMEMKKIEMFDSYNNGTLETWLQTGPPTQNSNVHFYYFFKGEIPDIDGRYVDEVYGKQGWLTFLIPGFDNSTPATGDQTFKIEYSDNVQSINTISDETLDFWGFELVLKQTSDPSLDIRIPKNFPTPASFTGMWNYGNMPVVLADGVQMDYDITEEPCYFRYKIPIEDNRKNVEISYVVIATGTWQLYSPVKFDEGNSCYNEVFYEKPISSPLKQIKSGIPLIDVQCSEGKHPVYKYNRMRVACVSDETEIELITRGWATMRLAMPGDNISEALCNNYEGKWHAEYEGCRDVTDLQCSLMGGKFVENLKICFNEICPDKLHRLCVTNPALIPQSLSEIG